MSPPAITIDTAHPADRPAVLRLLVARADARVVGVAVLAYTWTLEHGGQSC